MTTRTPTPQAISALLRRAGCARSNYGSKGVMWNEATPGYKAWKTCHRDHPEQPYVAVLHVADRVAFPAGTDEEWRACVKECRAHLELYAGVIRRAGYAAVVRDRGQEPPWLTILTVVTDEGNDR
jgi:hypothetical protein